MRIVSAILLLAGMALLAAAPRQSADAVAEELAAAVPVEADGQPIVIDDFLVFPAVGDLDGDGRKDLLVGQQKDGRLRVFRNVGTDARPVFGKPAWFDETVPDGRIPHT
jgi:FG-GAP repeat